MNYSDLIKEGTTVLKAADITEAALDARLLLEYICHTDRNTLYAHPDLLVDENQEKEYLELIGKRKQHIPLQHLTGSQEFMGLDFLVNENVLIPRQDTEFVVEEALRFLQDGMRVLDLCTGSGCILLSIMNYRNGISGTGIDISDKALEVAKENAKRLAINPEPVFLQGDLFEPLKDNNMENQKFDLIISNPPYIRPDVIEELMPEVKNHEPLLALCGGRDGLDFYRRIGRGAKEYLTNYGRLVVEIGYDQMDDVKKIFMDEGFSDVTGLNDYAGNPRLVQGIYIKGKEP